MSTSTSNQNKQRERVDPPTSDLTADDMFDSLTGFEEIAVKQTFGVPITELAKTDPLQMVRALVFAHVKRGGVVKDSEARKVAQGLTLGQVDDYFADDAGDPMPDEPVTEQGKGDTDGDGPPSS